MPTRPSRRQTITPTEGGAYSCTSCGKRFDWQPAVASHVGRPPKYCSGSCANRAGHRGSAVRRICVWCGRAFQTRSDSKAVTCGRLCRAANRATRLSCPIPRTHPAHPDFRPPAPPRTPEPRPDRMTCLECGAEFAPGSGHSKYCTEQCKRRASRRRRRAREHHAPGSWTWCEFIGAYLAGERRCAYCDELTLDPQPDHVTPLSRGGSNYLSNILPSCARCNGDKCDLALDEWAEDRARRGLPRPRLIFRGPRFRHFVATNPTGPARRMPAKAA